MKGCALSCLTGLIGFIAAIGAFFVVLRHFGMREQDSLGGAAVGLGLLATLSVSFFWSAFKVSRQGRLLRDALAGVPPVDGKWAGFSGVIRSRSPIVSPISGRSAIAYKYDVWRSEGTGKNAVRVSYYKGTALAPSTISTNLGTYKLLAVPQFDMPTSKVDAAEAIANMRAYIERTEFEPRTYGEMGKHKSVEEEWSDDDGNYRSDIRYDGAPEVEVCRLDEQMIAQDEQVCVIGLYSQMKGGIVPDANWANQTRVVKGDGQAGLEKLGLQVRNYVTVGVVLGAICALIFWRAMSAFPSAS